MKNLLFVTYFQGWGGVWGRRDKRRIIFKRRRIGEMVGVKVGREILVRYGFNLFSVE